MSYRPGNDQTLIMAKSSRSLSSRNILICAVVGLALVLIPYLFFGLVAPTGTRPMWFKVFTYLCTSMSLITTSVLCYRNFRHQRVLGSTWSWLLLGSGTLLYLSGTLVLLGWEFNWGNRPNLAITNLAFSGFYFMLFLALILSLLQQRISLNRPQGIVLVVVSAIATANAMAMYTVSGYQTFLKLTAPANHWFVQLAQPMQPLIPFLNGFCILMGLLLILMATILSIGFWSGRLSKTWQITAQAVFFIYLAELRRQYLSQTTGHQTGDLLEVLFMAGILQLGIAAAVEWENSYGVKRLLR